MEPLDRRTFLGAAAAVPLAASAGRPRSAAARPGPVKLSCNVYSFNTPLRDGTMSLDEVLRFCSDLGFAAVDPTGYYLTGYPEPPPAAYLHRVQRTAFLLGLDISGTGVRTDFARPDPAARRADVELVKRWLPVAAELHAPVLRVFAGRAVPEGPAREEATRRVVEALRECAEAGGREGVMIVLQNHADFVRGADDALELLERVGSDWFGYMVDIGSFTSADPYSEIVRSAPHAVTWQIKENVRPGGQPVPTDLTRLMRIVHDAGYRGYLPLETLGPGDPKQKMPPFLAAVREAMRDAGLGCA